MTQDIKYGEPQYCKKCHSMTYPHYKCTCHIKEKKLSKEEWEKLLDLVVKENDFCGKHFLEID